MRTRPFRSARPSARPVRALLLIDLLVLIALALGLWALRERTLAAERHALAALGAAIAAQADATLDATEAALRATRDELVDGRLRQPDRAAAQARLQARARALALPQVRALAVFDAQGERILSSRDDAWPTPPVADRDFFVAAQRGAASALFVGSPYLSRADGNPAIGVSLPWRGAAGEFLGAVVLVADPGFLDGGFDRLAPHADTALAITRLDLGRVSDGSVDRRAQRLPDDVLASLLADAAGGRTGASPAPRQVTGPDGTPRLVAVQPLVRHALQVVVSRDARAALAGWATLAGWIGAGTGAATVASWGLLLLWMRRRRVGSVWPPTGSGRADAAPVTQAAQASAAQAARVAQEVKALLASAIGRAELASAHHPIRPDWPGVDALPLGQGEAVLVVDDEPALVELAEALLADLGYDAHGAVSSADALAQVQAEPARFALVLTDEVMPDLTGTALAEALHAVRPDLPIVLASGGGGPQLARRAAAAQVVALIGKPLARGELAHALDRALHAAPV